MWGRVYIGVCCVQRSRAEDGVIGRCGRRARAPASEAQGPGTDFVTHPRHDMERNFVR